MRNKKHFFDNKQVHFFDIAELLTIWMYVCMYQYLAQTDPKLAGYITCWGKYHLNHFFKVYPTKKGPKNGDQVIKDTLFCAYFFPFHSFIICLHGIF